MNKNLLFIWIPKTGGTSVFSLLKASHNMRIFMDDYRTFDNTGSVTFGHLSPRHLVAEKVITKDYWDSCFPFTVIRNPYSRFVSLWGEYKKSRRIHPDTTLAEFAVAIGQSTRQPGLYNVRDHSQASSQVSWITPGMFTLRFETLHDDIKEAFGLDVPHLNKGSYGDCMSLFDSATQRLVADIYYDDFVMLKYYI